MSYSFQNKSRSPVFKIVDIGILLLFICLFGDCEPNVKLHIDEKVPPSFSFGGNGYLDFFSVIEISPENQNLPRSKQDLSKDHVIWQVWPKGPSEGNVPIAAFAYGEIPHGFIQKVPANGPPPSLLEGRVYEAGGPQVKMPEGVVRFTIQNGKTVQLSMPSSY